jgi:hypothetical protein
MVEGDVFVKIQRLGHAMYVLKLSFWRHCINGRYEADSRCLSA